MIKTRLFGYKLFLVVTLKVFISIDIHGMLKLRTFPSKEVVKEVINVRDRQISDSLNAYVLECAQNNDINAQLIIGLTYRTAKDASSCKQAVEWLSRAAYQDDARAQFHLGICYSQGLGVKKNNEEAMKWFLYADQNSFIPAQLLLIQENKDSFFDKQEQQKYLDRGVLAYKKEAELKKYDELIEFGLSCEYGDGIEKNIVAACESYMKAAHRDTRCLAHLVRCYKYANNNVPVYKESLEILRENPDYSYLLGLAYYHGIGCSRDIKQARQLFEFAAEKAHGCAQYCLAEIFEDTVFKDTDAAAAQHSSAVKYRKAIESLYGQAEVGWADAQLYLGLCYYAGKGIEKDSEEALAWFLKAANQDSPEAQYYVGNAGLHGDGCIKNEKIAYEWLLKSANNGYIEAKYLVGWLLAYGSEIQHDDKFANEWFEQAAQDGHVKSQYLFAQRCAKALGMAYSDGKVIKWMKKAADSGHKDAQYLLGTYYNEGVHTKIDHIQAIHWFTQAALQGHAYAKFLLGLCLATGRGCIENPEQVVSECKTVIVEIEKDAKAGKPDAQNLFGLAFQHALGKPKDLAQAKAWYKKAAKQGYACAQNNFAALCTFDSEKSQAIYMCQRAAQQGHAMSIRNLGILLYNQEKKEKLKAQQRTFASNTLSIISLFLIPSVSPFVRLMKMISDKGEFTDSVNCFTIAAQRDLPDAVIDLEELYKLGVRSAYINYAICLYYGWGCKRNYEKAFKVLQEAVVKNIRLAKGCLGECYYYGRGVKQDYKKAIELFESHDVDDGESFFYLAECYYFGYEVQKNLEKAVKLYKRAAQKNNAKAAYKFALCHLNGEGVERNEKRAQELFQQAVKLLREHIDYDDDLEITYLAYCYEKGLGVVQNYPRAAELYEGAAKNGEYTAQINLGYLYNHGYGVEQNFKKAFDLYESAAKYNRPEGKFYLGQFYEDGLEEVVTKPDYEQAIKWYRSAIELGSNEARLRLGFMYEKQENFKDAFIWYKQAAEAGVAEAQYKLGKCYQDELGIERDIVQAKRWLGKAERNGYNPK